MVEKNRRIRTVVRDFLLPVMSVNILGKLPKRCDNNWYDKGREFWFS